MPLEVIQITSDEQREIAYALRHTVFIGEQGGDPQLEVDEYDRFPQTRHFLGRDTDTGEFVATARCFPFPGTRRGKVGRVVVLRQCRGKQYGATLMAAVEAAMCDLCDSFELSAQFDKRAFYEKCGYQRADDELYLEGEIVHCKMVK